MSTMDTWQSEALQQLSQFFEDQPGARAFLVAGSLADPTLKVDNWSDLDVTVILADRMVDDYYLSTAWLRWIGQIVGIERHENPWAKTLRVCLDRFRRFDFVFIPESTLGSTERQAQSLLHRPHRVIWSRLADLEERLAALECSGEYQEVSDAELEHQADQFWFKASVAVAKVARNDLLVGLHLALDLARDSLVLQMMRRDREMRAMVHRSGGWGNELLEDFAWDGQLCSPEDILDLIRSSCEIFDKLAFDLSPRYRHRGPLFFSGVDLAGAAIGQICESC